MRDRNVKSKLKRWIILFGLILVLVFSARAYYNYQLSAISKQADIKLFVIAPGLSTSQIAEKLEGEKLIRSATFFKLMLKTSGQASSIQAGDFKLSPSMNASEILNELAVGVVDKWVTLIEGWRVEEMAKELNEQLSMNNDAFIKAAKKYEGYLFPDTYLLNPDVTVDDLIATLRANFDKKYTSELKAQIKSQGLTPEQGVILASIVEREGRSDKVRIEVASILLKRIKIKMKLDADATVQYAKHTKTPFWQPITREDYQAVKSPYNTYLNPGLPPGPICNPSLSSLKAVAEAHETAYLYYFHDSKGNSYYATTLEEHNDNVANYR